MERLQRAQSPDASDREARESLEAALLAANERLWVHRNVARIYRERFDDRKAATRALEQVAPLTCIEWRLAAAGWDELGERARATRCLEQAVANARTAGDLCVVALGHHDIGFADEGQLLIDGAATLATLAAEYWTVANTYALFDAHDRALALLQRGLDAAFAVTEIVTFAHALATYEIGSAALARTLANAERRASTVRDWIEIAVAHHRLLLDGDALDRCVARASALAVSPQDEREIAITRARTRLGLVDGEPPKLRPDQLLHRGARTFGWDRDPARLLGWLRARVPRTTVAVLAGPANYLADEATIALLGILKSGHVPHPLPAYLDALRTASRAESPGVDHVSRAFACTLVCIDDAAASDPDAVTPVLASLLESCLVLGPDAVSAAAALFAALADSYDATHATTPHVYLVVYAELALALAAAWLDPTDPRLAALVERMITDERRVRAQVTPRSPDFLFGLADHDPQDARWRSLACRTLVHPRHARLRSLLTGPVR